MADLQDILDCDIAYPLSYDGLDGHQCDHDCPLDQLAPTDIVALVQTNHVRRDDPLYCLHMARWMMTLPEQPYYDRLVPITLKRLQDGKITIFDGCHRICIARKLAAMGIIVHWPLVDGG